MGTYFVNETLVLGPADTGLTWRRLGDGQATISGGARLQLQWSEGANGVWSAKVDAVSVTAFKQLFVGGSRATRARTPNLGDNF